MTTSRQELLKINPLFTQFVVDVQLVHKPIPFEEGESVFLNKDDEVATLLAQVLSEELNREQELEFERNLDRNPFNVRHEFTFVESRLIVSSQNDVNNYLNELGEVLESIRGDLNEDFAMLLGVQNTPWLGQSNEYLPVKKASDYLSQRIDSEFSGGFLLKESELISFIPHLFWLTRCTGSMADVFMSFPNAKTIISLCKYGVLHFDFYDMEEEQVILNCLSKMNFKVLETCGDPIDFDRFQGRTLNL